MDYEKYGFHKLLFIEKFNKVFDGFFGPSNTKKFPTKILQN